jgi:ABC-type Na+ efflux pump permease subunit
MEAFRNRLLWLAAIVIAAGLGLALFLRQVAITESREIQTVVLAALLRFSSVFILATMVIASIVRESNDKVMELLLSLPHPRSRYILGKFAGYALVAVVLACVFSLPLALFAQAGGILAWMLSLSCELLIVAAVSLFCALSLTQMLSAVAAVAAFYLLARSISAMQIIAVASMAGTPSFADRTIAQVVDLVALVFPALDRMTETAWLLHGPPDSRALIGLLAQTAVYLVLIVAATLFDFYRRNF